MTGIIVATEQELSALLETIKDAQKTQIFDLSFYRGKINSTEIVLTKCGIGKVHSARTTQIMIDKFNVDKIINIGAAGAVNKELKIADIVIADKLVQYDFDISSLDDKEVGDIPGVGRFIKADENLVSLCKDTLKGINNCNVKIGTIASADYFCSDKEKAEQIRNDFGAECVEMEGAAIAQVCMLDNIPFLIIRGISDTPNDNNKIDYYTYCNIAAKQAVEFLYKFLG
ncbi:MAG: 5'-methylthioadenosine/adenosylhomocysteine nucleosidase [Clostridia bacterium]|nr:5'-methylthioadenosine/adenosylhomocysteine nucleosidase [Clostridia bacterium]